MAEASCSGPSPFKRLVEHQNRDASHHQDRLAHRAGASGHASFRSSPVHHAQGQDSFGTFLNGEPSAGAIPGVPHSPAGRLNAHAAVLQQPAPRSAQTAPSQLSRASHIPDLGNWAADFSRFSANGPPQQHHQVRAAPVAPVQMAQPNFQAAFGQPFPPMYSQRSPVGPGFVAPATAAPVGSDFDQEMARWMANNAGGNMAEVDAAMEQMARELELNENALPNASAATERAVAPQNSSHLTDLETPEIGNLSLHDDASVARAETVISSEEETQLDQQPASESTAKAKSAVSEAAERLLESVQHEDGDKWQKSVFLSLMRDFRDGKKDIVDNEIRQMDGDGGEPRRLDTT